MSQHGHCAEDDIISVTHPVVLTQGSCASALPWSLHQLISLLKGLDQTRVRLFLSLRDGR